ncbi:MAG: LLM class flavin-dependent oxidoreductase [candidate division NC10 bacterium]
METPWYSSVARRTRHEARSQHRLLGSGAAPARGQGPARGAPRVRLGVDRNFHKEMMVRRGFGDAAQRIQELFLAKRKDEAVAAVPDEVCDEMSLVGPPARIRERYRAWAECGITGLTIVTEQPEAMELMASLGAA